jgi:cellulose biosynthesis protein BcsQ
MDPSAYKRFDLPCIYVPAPESRPQQVQSGPSDSPAVSLEVSSTAAVSNPQAITQTDGPDQLTFKTHARPAGVEEGRDSATGSAARANAFETLPAGICNQAINTIHADLTALARLNERRLHQPGVLLVSAAAGGCGVTTVLAGLGRALSILGERVLLSDSGTPSTLDYFYGGQAEESRLLLSADRATPFEGEVHVLRTGTDPAGDLQKRSTRVHRAIAQLHGRCDRILVSGRDTLTAPVLQQVKASGLCLVILTPELRSALALPGILRAFASEGAGSVTPWFVLNRFNESSEEHLEFRAAFADELGSQLLPFCIPESSTVSRSLAHRVNPLDLAPQSEFADACFNLADWYRSRAGKIESGIIQPEENQLVSD